MKRMAARSGVRIALGVGAAALVLSGCGSGPSKEELEAAKNTIVCQLAGERLVIRFEIDEARLLLANGNRVTLHQIRSTSGLRYSNGLMELRGKGMDFEMIQDGVSTLLVDCQQYVPPAK